MGRQKKQQIKLDDVQLLDSRDVAKLLRVSYDTVCKWRQHHCGPKFYIMEKGAVRYRLDDLFEWQRQTLVPIDPLRL